MFAQYTKTCRFIDCDRALARENMAIDDALFSCFDKNSEPIFRLYTWFSSFTIGMSQTFNENFYEEFYEEFMKDFAKRMTGGGTLFHGNDISYSILIPSFFLEKSSVKESYEKICSFLLLFYKNIGLNAYFAKDDLSINLSKSPFCQNGFEPYDILIDGKKIGGNAQRRNKNIIFQHGSISLYKHNLVKENVGYNLEDFGIKLSTNEAKNKLKKSFLETFSIKLNPSTINEQEQKLKETLLKDKYDY